MSLGDGCHFAHICILPPQVKLEKYANAEAQGKAEVFLVITLGNSVLQRLCRTALTVTSGCLRDAGEETVEVWGGEV